MTIRHMFAAALAIALAAAPVRAADGICEEGFIRTWLVLAPVPLEDGVEAADGVDKEAVKDEAKLAPKAGDKVKVGDKEYEWKKVQAEEYFFDLNKHLGGDNDRCTAYAVAYVVAPDEMAGLTFKLGSDDGCKVYLNSKEIAKTTDDRPVDKDQDSFENITLKKGVNVLVYKVVNNGGEWQACARFTDKDGKPAAGLKVQETK
ncbi:MAG: hypothetical protein ACRC7O_18895 [Fimbriiglobus sp.]